MVFEAVSFQADFTFPRVSQGLMPSSPGVNAALKALPLFHGCPKARLRQTCRYPKTQGRPEPTATTGNLSNY